MENSCTSTIGRSPVDFDIATDEEFASLSKLLQEFTDIPNVDQAWTFMSNNGSQVIYSISQPNLLTNKRREFMLSSHISSGSDSVSFEWAPFPIEMVGVSTIVPSPSGSKLLVVRNSESDSPTVFEIWGSSQVEKEVHIPQSIHGSIYTDEWFGGISWNSDETLIAYVAEEPTPSKSTFSSLGYRKCGSTDKDCSSWECQGDWEEDWGETYAGKRQPALFVVNVNSGEIEAVQGIGRSLSVGQVVWAPSTEGSLQYLVFVGWPSETRKLGVKYCTSRPCALYAIKAPFSGSQLSQSRTYTHEDATLVNLTQCTSSAFFPRFSPNGEFLVFLSAKSAVDSGAHVATDSLSRINWPADGKLQPFANIVDVVPVVMRAVDGSFPGLYCTSILSKPWLSDGYTMILSSAWGSSQAIVSINILSGVISRVSSGGSSFSWNILTLDGDNIIAECSSPIDVPQIKYGLKAPSICEWNWKHVSSPIYKCSEEVRSLLSSRKSSIVKIPVRGGSENLTVGACEPYEAIFVSSKSDKLPVRDPLIVVMHGGPHSVSLSSFSKSFAFLSSLGYSLLIVNYSWHLYWAKDIFTSRGVYFMSLTHLGSLGFGEEALQSLPGKVGTQDVNDVLAAIDHIIEIGLADPSKIAVTGNSHGGFLTTHLIAQAPEKFAAAAPRNPVCNFALMVGASDIPDWCYVEAFGCQAKSYFAEAPLLEHLELFYKKSPVSNVHKVKTPTLFLLGAKDLRVPICNGLQYARALKEKAVEVKVIMFPDDVHALERPQSEFEGFLNMAVWFNKYCK